ncbi:MAG: 4,5-DOPA dioxygenase extradiol [Vulcanimicrobiaceae bacterium]
MPAPMPVAFFGHGSPANTLAHNRYTEAWRNYAATLAVPRAVLVVSAHWYVPGIKLSAAARPATIHDFNNRFDKELFEFAYAVDGSAELVERVRELLRPANVDRDTSWGIDHGAFSVLAHLFPKRDVPVVELSIDRAKPAGYHYELARRLSPLRDEGVFIMGSGNVIHNLELADFHDAHAPFAWAQRFDERFRELLADGDHERLVGYRSNGADADLAVPTPDHYLPFLYVLAQQRSGEAFSRIVDGFEGGSVGMLSAGFG